jgi:multidrug resistance efflux pump
MPVRLHGRRATAAIGAVHPAPVAGAPSSPPPKKRSPVTVGRAVYYVALVGGTIALAWWLVTTVLFGTASGFVQRDTYRLAPRERGRIVRVGVRVGDRVAEGDPLVWLDYAAAADEQAGSAFLSDASMREAARAEQQTRLQQRRHDLERQRASLLANIASLRSKATNLAADRDQLAKWRRSAQRLLDEGAATESEVAQIALKLAAVETERFAAVAEAEGKRVELASVDKELGEATRLLAAGAVPPAPVTSDPGVIGAPRAGRVAWIAHQPGEVVSPSDVVIVIIDDSDIRVRAFVAPKDARTFATGRDVTVKLPTGESLRGRVAQLYLLTSAADPTATASAPGAAMAAPPREPRPTGLFGSDANDAFLLADITLLDPPRELPGWPAVGAPCEVRARRVFGGAP